MCSLTPGSRWRAPRCGCSSRRSTRSPTWYERAHEAAQEALKLDPDLAETHEALAAVHRSTDFNWLQTIEEATRALELKPSLDQPHLYLASAFMHLGLFERAAAEATTAIDLNPANTDEPLRVQGAMAMYAGRFDEAVRILEQATAARGAAAEWNLAYAYYNAGRKDKAESMLRKISSESARSKRRAQATLAGVLAARGERAEAQDTDPGGTGRLVHGPSRRLRPRSGVRTARHAEGSARTVD